MFGWKQNDDSPIRSRAGQELAVWAGTQIISRGVPMSQAPVYYADPYAGWLDDFAMTFQIVLVGQDGIVLGSDRLFVERGLRDLMQRKRQSYRPTTNSKFYVSADELTVCAFAGGP